MTTVSLRKKQVRNGLAYLPNETKPFTGVFVGWHDNGRKWSEGNYKDGKKDGKKDGTYTVWYDNGQKKSERNYKDGKKDGKSTEWDKYGRKHFEVNYKDGKKNGKSTEWFLLSEKTHRLIDYEKIDLEILKKCVINYKDGKKDGKSTYRHAVWSFKYDEVNYKDDELVYWTEWDKDSQKQQAEVNYKVGKAEWIFVIFVVVIIFFLN
jgi:antitoxin component YwqK of YwqJK toxin-antitoxin module